MHDLYNFITNYRGIYHVDTKYLKIFMIYSLIYLYFMIIMCNMYLFIFENYLVFFLPHFVIYYISIHIHAFIICMRLNYFFWNIFIKKLFINWFLKYKLSILIIWRRSCITIHYLLMSSWHILAKTKRDIFFNKEIMNGLFLYWCLLYRLLWYGILKVTLLVCSFFRREGTSIISCWALYFVHFLVTVVLHKKSLVALLFNEECCFATFKATMKIIFFHALRPCQLSRWLH